MMRYEGLFAAVDGRCYMMTWLEILLEERGYDTHFAFAYYTTLTLEYPYSIKIIGT